MSVCESCGWGDGRHARNCTFLTEPSLTELLGPKPSAGYLRAVEQQRWLNSPRSKPIIACTSEDIDTGMFHMEHGYYPGEEPE